MNSRVMPGPHTTEEANAFSGSHSLKLTYCARPTEREPNPYEPAIGGFPDSLALCAENPKCPVVADCRVGVACATASRPRRVAAGVCLVGAATAVDLRPMELVAGDCLAATATVEASIPQELKAVRP